MQVKGLPVLTRLFPASSKSGASWSSCYFLQVPVNMIGTSDACNSHCGSSKTLFLQCKYICGCAGWCMFFLGDMYASVHVRSDGQKWEFADLSLRCTKKVAAGARNSLWLSPELC